MPIRGIATPVCGQVRNDNEDLQGAPNATMNYNSKILHNQIAKWEFT